MNKNKFFTNDTTNVPSNYIDYMQNKKGVTMIKSLKQKDITELHRYINYCEMFTITKSYYNYSLYSRNLVAPPKTLVDSNTSFRVEKNFTIKATTPDCKETLYPYGECVQNRNANAGQYYSPLYSNLDLDKWCTNCPQQDRIGQKEITTTTNTTSTSPFLSTKMDASQQTSPPVPPSKFVIVSIPSSKSTQTNNIEDNASSNPLPHTIADKKGPVVSNPIAQAQNEKKEPKVKCGYYGLCRDPKPLFI